jgi:hypothetical protein
MLQTASPLILKLSLFLMTAVVTHLVMSFGQTLIHYKVAHHPMGGRIFRNHINFHHTHYSDARLVSRTYLGDEGNTTPYFFIPIFLVGGCAYLLLPMNLFVVMVIASAASFYAHVFFDKEYHVRFSVPIEGRMLAHKIRPIDLPAEWSKLHVSVGDYLMRWCG